MLKPRYYQDKAVKDFMSYVEDNPGKHPLIVLPTGSGKSLVQAMIVKDVLAYPDTRILLLTHQKELIIQNADELWEYTDSQVDIGIYSAGVGLRDAKNRVTVAGIQSVYKRAWTDIGYRDLIIIDEAHLVNSADAGMYRTFLKDMTDINKKIVIMGMSATVFRLKTGLLCDESNEEKLFDDICHETTIKELIDPEHYRNKDKKQYLCNLVSKSAVNKADLSQVHIRGGEYVPGEMEKAFQANDLVCKAVREIKDLAEGRKKILVFCAGIKHCEEVTEKMNAIGLVAKCVHSQKGKKENDEVLQEFKDGKFNYLCNVGILTTGFNAKDIDCITLLRSTMSAGLYYQMCGRGLRLFPGKENCLILDFGRNIERHGPIDKIEIRKNKKGKREVLTCPMKECPECHELLHPTVMICPVCNYEFPQKEKHKEKHEETASEQEILSKWKKPTEEPVLKVRFNRHEKIGKPDSLRVDFYISEMTKYSTWICLNHEGFARQKALQTMKNFYDKPINTVDEALAECEKFRKPSRIIVDTNSKFPEIKGYIFEKEKDADEMLEELVI